MPLLHYVIIENVRINDQFYFESDALLINIILENNKIQRKFKSVILHSF